MKGKIGFLIFGRETNGIVANWTQKEVRCVMKTPSLHSLWIM